jgi:hypothetical protein
MKVTVIEEPFRVMSQKASQNEAATEVYEAFKTQRRRPLGRY